MCATSPARTVDSVESSHDQVGIQVPPPSPSFPTSHHNVTSHTDTIKDVYEAAEQNMLTRQAAPDLDDNQQPAKLMGEHLNSDEAGHKALTAL